MGNLGAFALIGVLVILTLLCHTGYSLRCYNCFATDNQCNMTLKCRVSLNACLHAKSASGYYMSCWNMADCNMQTVKEKLKERKLTCRCCQKDLCNRNSAVTFIGKSVLLVVPLLAIAWNLSL